MSPSVSPQSQRLRAWHRPARSGNVARELAQSKLPLVDNGATMVYHWCTIRRATRMIKTLVKHGNSWALVIDRPILDLLKFDPESPVEITTDGQSMTIAPVGRDTRKAAIRAARKKINPRYSKAFKKLAE